MAKLQKKKQNNESSANIDEDTYLSKFEVEANKEDLYKKNDKKIKAEKKKLLNLLAKIDKNLLKICDSLINNIAFMAVTLDSLIESMKKNGIKEYYKNGQNQYGYKRSVDVEVYSVMQKNFQSSLKVLIDMLQRDGINDDEAEEIKKYLARGRT